MPMRSRIESLRPLHLTVRASPAGVNPTQAGSAQLGPVKVSYLTILSHYGALAS
jgi:hypothetical protein